MEEGFCISKPRGGAYGGGTKCGRWNPTAEQVKVLTDLFRSGLRTPSTDQIQRISSQLSCYGKIESKNVFYWFQNHKARERQKRRRISKDEHKENHYDQDKNSSNMNMMNGRDEINQVFQAPPEKVMETLQLFPLNSFRETETDRKQFKIFAEDWNASSFSSYATNHMARHIEHHHPALDLRLSFIS